MEFEEFSNGTKEININGPLLTLILFFTPDPRYSPAPIESGLVEGDFKLTEKQKVNMKLFKNVYGPPERAASGRESERWPGAIIPYVFDCSVSKFVYYAYEYV